MIRSNEKRKMTYMAKVVRSLEHSECRRPPDLHVKDELEGQLDALLLLKLLEQLSSLGGRASLA